MLESCHSREIEILKESNYLPWNMLCDACGGSTHYFEDVFVESKGELWLVGIASHIHTSRCFYQF